MKNCFVLGVDSLDLNFVFKTFNLRNFKRLRRDGVVGKLESTILPITIPAWPAIFSGLNPGKLGTVCFGKFDRNYRFVPFTSKYFRGKMIWDYLTTQKIRTITINVPGTFPSYPIKGIMVNLFSGPHGIYPKKLSMEISNFIKRKIVKTIEDAFTTFEKELEVLELLLEKEWNLFVYVARITDDAIHLGNFKDIKRSYKLVDQLLGKIIDYCDEKNIDLLIVSDHGTKKTKKKFNINSFLQSNNFLKLKRISKSYELLKLIHKSGLRLYLKNVFRVLPKKYRKKIKVHEEGLLENVIWKKTKAVGLTTSVSSFSGIYINKVGRFRKGIVSDIEFEKTRNELIRIFESLEIIENVWKKEEIFSGNMLEDLPDIIVKTKNEYFIDIRPFSEIISKDERFVHRYFGFFGAYGPDFERKKNVDCVVYDITPTLLHLFGVRIPKNVDGMVLKQIFSKKSKAYKETIKFRKSKTKKSKSISSNWERRLIEERLKALGYI